ncbi:MAG TPA: glycosyltransferase [Usitatibacter sp.]|nr:glycosyltransferase [Usitatibacter sp.]
MRIGVVAPLVAPLAERQPYGNHVFLCDLARGLASRGHEVVVYAAERSRVPGVSLARVAVDPRVRGRFALLDGVGEVEARLMDEAFARLFERARRHGHDVLTQHAFDRGALACCTDIPTLHTLHLPPMRAEVVEAARTSPAALGTVSTTCAKLWRDATGREVLALPNGVPEMALPECEPRPSAVIAGRISREKGTDAAIRVARRAGLVPLVVGEIYDPEYFRAKVVPEMAGVALVPTLAREELRAMMACASVTLMPVEWDEPFGLVAAESQLAGCPVAGYRRGALPEVVEEGVGGHLVEAGDEDALTLAIAEAMRLDRARIRREARARFGMDACVERYERELARLAA